jgi:hypothetical protein
MLLLCVALSQANVTDMALYKSCVLLYMGLSMSCAFCQNRWKIFTFASCKPHCAGAMCRCVRLDSHPSPHPLEKKETRGALRFMYGCLTYLNDGALQGPITSYGSFLGQMDASVLPQLSLDHVFEFLRKMNSMGKANSRVFILIDEVNAAKGVKQLLST